MDHLSFIRVEDWQKFVTKQKKGLKHMQRITKQNGNYFLAFGDESPRRVLHAYIRDHRGTKRGMVVALELNGDIRFGYSKCANIDVWDEQSAANKSIGRALANSGKHFDELRPEIRDRLYDIYDRAQRYFKKELTTCG
jgi:hypothetical protein